MGTADNNKATPETTDSDAGGMLGLARRLARQLPGADFAEEQLHNIETRALRELKQRLASVDDRRLPAPAMHHAEPGQSISASPLAQHPGALMADLLDRATDQTTEQAQLYLYSMLLSQLVPDEARLLGALSDGGEHPLLHVGLGAPIGAPRRVAENFSALGKTASLKLKENTPAYITHLRGLGLLEEGPEDRDQEIKYQIMESEKAVRDIAKQAEKGSAPGMSVRYIRRVIRISSLGRQLWEACLPAQPDDE